MSQTVSASLAVLTGLQPVDGTAASLRAAIAATTAKRASLYAQRGTEAAAAAQVVLQTDDTATIAAAQAAVEATAQDIVRVEAWLAELTAQLVPAQVSATVTALTAAGQQAETTITAYSTWRAQTVPTIVADLVQGAALRSAAQAAYQAFNQSVATAGLSAADAASLPCCGTAGLGRCLSGRDLARAGGHRDHARLRHAQPWPVTRPAPTAGRGSDHGGGGPKPCTRSMGGRGSMRRARVLPGRGGGLTGIWHRSVSVSLSKKCDLLHQLEHEPWPSLPRNPLKCLLRSASW